MDAKVPDADRSLDVREMDGPPFDRIVDAADALGDEETLCLVSGFEPVPLYGVLEGRGFEHESVRVADDEWHVLITRR